MGVSFLSPNKTMYTYSPSTSCIFPRVRTPMRSYWLARLVHVMRESEGFVHLLVYIHVHRLSDYCLNNVQPDIVDIKPANMEELTEVITAAQFHPTSCHMLIYSSSKGTIRLCDMREKALCDEHAKCEFGGGSNM